MSRVGKSKFQLIEVDYRNPYGDVGFFELQIYYVKKGANVGTFVTEAEIISTANGEFKLPVLKSTDVLHIYQDAKRIAEASMGELNITFSKFINLKKLKELPSPQQVIYFYDMGSKVTLPICYLGSTEDGNFFKTINPSGKHDALRPLSQSELTEFMEYHIELTDDKEEEIKTFVQTVYEETAIKMLDNYRQFDEAIRDIINDLSCPCRDNSDSITASPLSEILRTYSK